MHGCAFCNSLLAMCRAENLEHYFCSEQWTDTEHRPGKSKINEVVVYYLDASEIDRPLEP